MYNILNRLKNEQTLCEISSDTGNSNKFTVGYILDCDDDFALIETVSAAGRHNGFICLCLDDIYEIRTGTDYIANIEKLMPYYSFSRKDLPLGNGKVLDAVIDYVRNANKVCSVLSVSETRICGLLEDYNSDYITIGILDNYGGTDGTGYIRTDDITEIEFDSELEIKLAILKNSI